MLVACGGDNKDDVTFVEVKTEVMSPIATDNYSQLLLLDDSSVVSLAGNVSDPQGFSLSLVSVESETDDCIVSAVDESDLSFSVEKSTPSLCAYHYIVKNNPPNPNEAKTVSSDSYVFVSKTRTASTLLPISKTSTINSEVFIDLKSELGSDLYPDNYQLESVKLVMGAGSITDTDTINGTITFQTGDTKGISRIIYSLAANDSTDIKVGYIDIAVSLESNSMPVAESFTGPENVPLNTEITIDVAGHISDPDGDELQLTDAYSFNSEVSATDPDSFTNTSFNFKADEPGRYDVSYYIYDHRNGYATGTVRINVLGPSVPWSDITLLDDEIYTAPWEKQGADAYHIPYQNITPELIDGSEYQIALFNYSTADTLCRVRGMLLPTVAQLNKLYGEVGDVSVDKKWPTVTHYWTKSKSGYDLSSGGEVALTDSDLAIMTCVQPATLSTSVTIDNAFATGKADSGDGFFDEIEASVKDLQGNGVGDEAIYAYSTDPSISISPSNVSTDSDGKANLVVRSTEPGTFNISVRYLTQAVDTVVSFIQDKLADFYVTPDHSEIDSGQLVSLNSFGTYSSGETEKMTTKSAWSVTEGSDVVTVDDEGTVKGIKPGDATVMASYVEYDSNDVEVASWTDKATITVKAVLSYLTMTPERTEINVGDTGTITAKAHYIGGSTRTVTATYVSRNPDIVTVSGSTFTGVSGGSTLIDGSYTENGKTEEDITRVTVVTTLLGLTVTPSSVSLTPGGKQELAAKVTYSDSSERTVVPTYSSSDTAVATVSDSTITAVGEGTATITATYTEGTQTVTNTISVSVTDYYLQYIKTTPTPVTLKVGETQQLKTTAYYKDGTSGTVYARYYSEDPDRASVSTGGLVTAINPGKIVIRSSYQYAGHTEASHSDITVE